MLSSAIQRLGKRRARGNGVFPMNSLLAKLYWMVSLQDSSPSGCPPTKRIEESLIEI